MRFAAWPAVYLLALVPALLALYAYAFRRQRQALAAFVAHEWRRGCCRRRPAPVARASCLVGGRGLLRIALMQPQWGAAPRSCRCAAAI